MSYGIYLWHLPVLFWLGAHTQLPPWLALGIALPATIALAALTWHCVEQPVLRRFGAGDKAVPVGWRWRRSRNPSERDASPATRGVPSRT